MIDISQLVTKENKLQSAKDAKAAKLSEACAAAICAGFECSALGDPHHYPTKSTDQQNLLSSIADSLLAVDDPVWTTPFWCTPLGQDDWAMRPHSHAEIQRVGREAKAAVLLLMAKNLSLAKAVRLATTMSDIDAIQWDDPPPAA